MITPFLQAQPDAAATWYDIVDSPVGRLALTCDSRDALTGLYLLDAGDRSATVRPEWLPRPAGAAAAQQAARGFGVLDAAAFQLREYFAGERTEFDLQLAPRGTAFQLSVWAALAAIPFGKTVSYGDIAVTIGKSLLASRAVGLANGRNPISIILPCHRVIGADGSLTGYGWGVDRKEWFLRHEGAMTPRDTGLEQGVLFGG
jgi:methylated-DNA-[protein]-cysteine S-methyltransferase